MNHSELGANICNRRQARENAREQVTNGFGFDWFRKWVDIFLANHKVLVAMQSQSSRLKSALKDSTQPGL